MLAWDKAVRGEHGGAREGAGRKPTVAAEVPDHDPETGEIKLDNIQLEKPVSDAPTGTSAQAGLRRLEKAASAGDGNAADLLRRVIDPADAMTVNGACVAMGWRKPMLSVVNTPDGLAAAATVHRAGLAPTIAGGTVSGPVSFGKLRAWPSPR